MIKNQGKVAITKSILEGKSIRDAILEYDSAQKKGPKTSSKLHKKPGTNKGKYADKNTAVSNKRGGKPFQKKPASLKGKEKSDNRISNNRGGSPFKKKSASLKGQEQSYKDAHKHGESRERINAKLKKIREERKKKSTKSKIK